MLRKIADIFLSFIRRCLKVVSNMSKQRVECYVCSLSTSTIVYKGQFTPRQLFAYYDDLNQVSMLKKEHLLVN